MTKEPTPGCIYVVIEIPRGQPQQVRDRPRRRPRLPRPAAVHGHDVPRRLRLRARHARRRRRPARRPRAARRPGVPGRVGRGPAGRRAVHAGRGRRGRQADLRAAQEPRWADVDDLERPHAAADGRDPALLRGLQGARARQVLLDAGHRRPRRRLARDRARRRRRTTSPHGRRRDSTPARSDSARRAARRRSAPARSPSSANASAGCGRSSGA